MEVLECMPGNVENLMQNVEMELRMIAKLKCNKLINVLAIIYLYILSETIF